MDRREGYRMRSEEPQLLAFPYPLALHVSSLSLNSKGIFAKEEEGIVKLQTWRKKTLSTIFLVFPIGF